MFEYNFPIGYKANIHWFECAFIIIRDWWVAPSMFLGPFMLIRPNNALLVNNRFIWNILEIFFENI